MKHSYNLKNVKNPYDELLLLVNLQVKADNFFKKIIPS